MVVRDRMRAAAAALLVLAAGCSTGPRYAPKGAVAPTVSGGGSNAYPDLVAAKTAFARTDGPLTAVLEDAAWIRLEPDPTSAAERHPDYVSGLTSFEVTLKTDTFVRPTEETYVLQDSLGQSVSSKPTAYRGSSEASGRTQVATFTLSFPHVLTKDIEWVRVTRQGVGGGTVQWDFPR